MGFLFPFQLWHLSSGLFFVRPFLCSSLRFIRSLVRQLRYGPGLCFWHSPLRPPAILRSLCPDCPPSPRIRWCPGYLLLPRDRGGSAVAQASWPVGAGQPARSRPLPHSLDLCSTGRRNGGIHAVPLTRIRTAWAPRPLPDVLLPWAAWAARPDRLALNHAEWPPSWVSRSMSRTFCSSAGVWATFPSLISRYHLRTLARSGRSFMMNVRKAEAEGRPSNSRRRVPKARSLFSVNRRVAVRRCFPSTSWTGPHSFVLLRQLTALNRMTLFLPPLRRCSTKASCWTWLHTRTRW